jgi:Bacterial transcriptional activator domain
MLALYRSARQADALRVYREGRDRLVDELGIEPGPELQALERAILHHDAALSASRGVDPAGRGPVICVGVAPVSLLSPLGRELLVVELAEGAASLSDAQRRLARLRGVTHIRTAAFTTEDRAGDIVRLAREQAAELLVVAAASDDLLASAPCDVALTNGTAVLGAGAIVVPFGGAQTEWPALELGAWLARAHERPLRLVGTEASGQQRDASRALAAASLALQRFAGITAETALVPAGSTGVLARSGAAVVASLPRGGLDATRRALLESDLPVLLVHGGLRPSGLAPDQTMTRFSWSLSGS